MISVCFVCLGNICRSPTAEGVFRRLVSDAGLTDKINIDSAGTGDYHVGESPDARSRSAASRRGYQLTGVARQFQAGDLDTFDYVLAADRSNLQALRRLCSDEQKLRKIHLLRSFDPIAPQDAEVPDPYYGGAAGFDEVIDICERACRGLLEQIRASGRL